MAEKKKYDAGLVAVGKLLLNKRKQLGPDYSTRERFIELRCQELFNDSSWISLRHLSNIELGKNWISITMLLSLSAALEQDPVDLFSEIIYTYRSAISEKSPRNNEHIL